MKQLLLIMSAVLSMLNMHAQMEKSERYTRGWSKLQEIDGEAGENVVNNLGIISPDLARFIIEYSFGDVYSLNFLNNKSKEIAAVSSLIAQGATPQLKVHLNGALNSGCLITEVKEIILQMSVYTGFPGSINAMNTFQEVLNERKNKGINDLAGSITNQETDSLSRYSKGAEALSLLDSLQVQHMEKAYRDFSPELVQFTLEYAFADIHSRKGLEKKYRQIATVAALATLGNAPSQLKFHISGALNVGVTGDEIKEVMLLMTVYAGFPAAINGTNILREVMDERSDK
ncbi:4-carboxymuconolactone decarboxylase [Dysgonomonas hofstadii]|uniref:4-carboxymuconolactone decarboxylase n=1 Tax=Dysgonomonas hofstadii TaxID=637886 RepID=A0A840CFG1_9BACT|nr:carboxymuconolactone decarboxylase family protein [Dysgonomonas hofstadii]MBB4034737.1 4-carboxymuconolactone decarboxylase [Dysgonomonas hofstadii]